MPAAVDMETLRHLIAGTYVGFLGYGISGCSRQSYKLPFVLALLLGQKGSSKQGHNVLVCNRSEKIG